MNSNDTTSVDARLEQARTNPSRVYGTPADVLVDPTLDAVTRRRILEGWALDERRLMAATEENMAGGRAHRLNAVMGALRRLDADDTPVRETAG